MQLFPLSEVVAFALLAGAAVAAVQALTSWGRSRFRFLIAGVATTAAFTAWNLTLNATHAVEFNTDAPVIPLSWADAGSGVLTFTIVALVFGLVSERDGTAGSIVRAAALAGLMATLVDLFVL